MLARIVYAPKEWTISSAGPSVFVMGPVPSFEKVRCESHMFGTEVGHIPFRFCEISILLLPEIIIPWVHLKDTWKQTIFFFPWAFIHSTSYSLKSPFLLAKSPCLQVKSPISAEVEVMFFGSARAKPRDQYEVCQRSLEMVWPLDRGNCLAPDVLIVGS